MKLLAETDIGNDGRAERLVVPVAAQGLRLVAVHRTRSSRPPTRWSRTAPTFLFDGSDQMPGEVGAGSFWKEMTAWITGQQDLDTALKNIDDSWPTS